MQKEWFFADYDSHASRRVGILVYDCFGTGQLFEVYFKAVDNILLQVF
jgi:hypothetical protein